MSTRRARIKAITSLPVRRKNTEANDNLKNKQPVLEIPEKQPRSPQSPRSPVKSQEVKEDWPVIKSASPVFVSSEATSVIICTPPKEKPHPYDVKVTSVESPPHTPPRAEKVSVITPNLNYKPNPSTSSPIKNDFASPYVPSPKVTAKPVGVIVQAPKTPLKSRTPAAHTIDENNELQITSKTVNSVVYNSVSSKSAVSDDYNVPSVPESVDNDGVMDGIVPLQSESNVPKPIDLLKNEIISENAEVLFDPIIPLPSPSKVRPKLRPTPRLGPHRRNSTVGSASESEDENRRGLHGGASTPGLIRQRRDSQSSSVPNRESHRTRNDSVCSSVSQVNGQASSSSPVKEKTSSKSRRKEAIRRMAAIRRRNESLKRESLTMFDLIFYNPTTNPIVPDQDEVKAKADNKKDEEEKAKNTKEEKDCDKPLETPVTGDSTPVPQIKLGPNGEIVIDKSSLVISQTDANREVSSVVREGAWGGGGGGGRYTRAPRTAEWSACETVRFYRALAAIGTDFSLMAPLFPDRNRRELKLKFKKEEKINGAQVDKALRAGNSWDPNRLKTEFQNEREEAARKAKKDAKKLTLEKMKEKQRMKKARELRVRNSRASKALQSTMLPGVSKQKNDITTADDLVKRALKAKKNKGTNDSEDDPQATASVDIIPTPPMATLTLINNAQATQSQTRNVDNMATLSRVNTPLNTPPLNLNAMPDIPSNIETGSLVVLTVNDPSSPSKKMLQTYIAHSAGKLTPVALPPTFLNSVVGYMKKGTPKGALSASASPQRASPAGCASGDGRAGASSPLSNQSPSKRKQISSYTITQL